jgi:hypothetical protein
MRGRAHWDAILEKPYTCKDLGIPVVGAVSDAQESLLQAIAALWPDVPHQLCQFHYLREATRPMFDVDRKLRKQIRKALQQDVRAVRRQIQTHTSKRDGQAVDDQRTAAQLQILDDYALAAQTARNVDALQPVQYASPVVSEALDAIATSLEGREQGAPRPALCAPNARGCLRFLHGASSGATS